MSDTRPDRIVAQTNIGGHVAHLEEHVQHNIRNPTRELNNPSLANRLPHDLLAIIFTLCLPPVWNKRYTFSQFLAISHTCRTWRDAFLDTPALWAVLPCDTATQTLMALQRAGDAPRTLNFVSADLRGERKMSAALESLDMPRVRHINLHCSSDNYSTIRSTLVGTAPHLLHLSLSAHDMTHQIAIAVNEYAYRELIVPCLVDLCLHECPRVLCTLRSFHRLRSLCLTNEGIYAAEGLQVPLRSLISLLQGTPEMESIELKSVLSDDDVYLSNLPEGSVHLPDLRRLILDDWAQTSLLFMRTLHCPVLFNVHIRLVTLENELTLPVNGIPLAASYLRSMGHLLHSVSFSQEDTFYKLLALTTHRESAIVQWHDREETGFCLEFEVSMTSDLADQVIRIMRDLVASLDIRVLELSSDQFSLLLEMITVSWPPLTGVRELWVHGDVEAFYAIRALDQIKLTRSVGGCLLMPNLEELHFQGDTADFQVHYSDGTLRSLLKEGLRTRAEWGTNSLAIYFHEKTRGVTEKDLQEIMENTWVKAFHCDLADVEPIDESDIDEDNE